MSLKPVSFEPNEAICLAKYFTCYLLCCCLFAKSCPILLQPTNYISPGSTVHGISQARILSGLPFPSLGSLSNPRIKPAFPTLADGFFINEPPVIYLLSLI